MTDAIAVLRRLPDHLISEHWQCLPWLLQQLFVLKLSEWVYVIFFAPKLLAKLLGYYFVARHSI